MTTIQKPTIGRIVEVSINDGERNSLERRCAIVAQTWTDDMISCRVFLDGSNDRGISAVPMELLWLTSIHYNADGVVPDGQMASWRYPPRSDAQIEV